MGSRLPQSTQASFDLRGCTATLECFNNRAGLTQAWDFSINIRSSPKRGISLQIYDPPQENTQKHKRSTKADKCNLHENSETHEKQEKRKPIKKTTKKQENPETSETHRKQQNLETTETT